MQLTVESRPAFSSLPNPDRQHVLVVDDDPAIASMNQEILEMELGDRVLVSSFNNPLEVLDQIQAGSLKPPRVILTDARLPYISGEELVARVRDVFPDVEAMIITGDSPLAARLREEGKRVLEKAYEIDDLVASTRLMLAASAI